MIGNKTEGKKWAKPQKTKEEGGKEQTIRTARGQRHGGSGKSMGPWLQGARRNSHEQSNGLRERSEGRLGDRTLRSTRQAKLGKIKHKLILRDRRILQRRGEELI